MSSSNPADNDQIFGPLPAQKRKVLVRKWERVRHRSGYWRATLACGHLVDIKSCVMPIDKSMVCFDCYRARKGGA